MLKSNKLYKQIINCTHVLHLLLESESVMGHKFGGASGLESGHGMAPRYGGVSGRAGNE